MMRPERWSWEVILASVTLGVAWLASRSIGEAARALDGRVAARQGEIERLAAAQAQLTVRLPPDSDTSAVPPAAEAGSLPSLFPGRQLVLYGTNSYRLLRLEPSYPPGEVLRESQPSSSTQEGVGRARR